MTVLTYYNSKTTEVVFLKHIGGMPCSLSELVTNYIIPVPTYTMPNDNLSHTRGNFLSHTRALDMIKGTFSFYQLKFKACVRCVNITFKLRKTKLQFNSNTPPPPRAPSYFFIIFREETTSFSIVNNYYSVIRP